MDATAKRNGVLIYVAVQDKSLLFMATGINELVANDFWDTTKDTIQNHLERVNLKKVLLLEF